jgi:hypothetical protein
MIRSAEERSMTMQAIRRTVVILMTMAALAIPAAAQTPSMTSQERANL